MDGVTQFLLCIGWRELLLRPDPQRHCIGGLLGFSSGLQAEIALLVSMEASAVVGRWFQAQGGASGYKRLRRPPQMLPALTPRNPVAFGRSNDELPGLKEQGAPEQADADQSLDQTAKATTGVGPARRFCGVSH